MSFAPNESHPRYRTLHAGARRRTPTASFFAARVLMVAIFPALLVHGFRKRSDEQISQAEDIKRWQEKNWGQTNVSISRSADTQKRSTAPSREEKQEMLAEIEERKKRLSEKRTEADLLDKASALDRDEKRRTELESSRVSGLAGATFESAGGVFAEPSAVPTNEQQKNPSKDQTGTKNPARSTSFNNEVQRMRDMLSNARTAEQNRDADYRLQIDHAEAHSAQRRSCADCFRGGCDNCRTRCDGHSPPGWVYYACITWPYDLVFYPSRAVWWRTTYDEDAPPPKAWWGRLCFLFLLRSAQIFAVIMLWLAIIQGIKCTYKC
jgi:hypothetical protein